MKQEIIPKETTRAQAFELWMKAPMPMVTLTKTFDVTRMYWISKRRCLKFNMLLAWCIGRAASRVEEFFLLPEGGKLFKYDALAINVIVNNRNGGINSCDIPYSDDLEVFNSDYKTLSRSAANACQSSFVEDAMVIGTSAMTATELDGIVNQYTDLFNNPMVMWGKYRKGLFRITLPVSFQFHHVQMDGGHATRFLEYLQNEMKVLNPN